MRNKTGLDQYPGLRRFVVVVDQKMTETTEAEKMAQLPVGYFDQHVGCCALQTLLTFRIKVIHPLTKKGPEFTVPHTFLYVKHVFRFPRIEEGDPQKGHCSPSS